MNGFTQGNLAREVHESGGVLMEVPNNAPDGSTVYMLSGGGRHFICYGSQAAAEAIISEKIRLESQKENN